MSVGFPATLRLHEFGYKIYEAFGHFPYHVGSSLMQKTGWRDVDVRLMLADDIYAAMGLGDPTRPQNNAKWCALCQAFTSWGRELTGLPIDFQIQQLSYANREEDGSRSFLGLIPGKIVTNNEVIGLSMDCPVNIRSISCADSRAYKQANSTIVVEPVSEHVSSLQPISSLACKGLDARGISCVGLSGHEMPHIDGDGTYYCRFCGTQLGINLTLAEFRQRACTGKKSQQSSTSYPIVDQDTSEYIS